jgi:hypothetical protein
VQPGQLAEPHAGLGPQLHEGPHPGAGDHLHGGVQGRGFVAPVLLLHDEQAGRKLDSSCVPPRTRGTTWSTVFA